MRSKVLALFRSLHRTRQSVFKGDEAALNTVRKRINEEFQKNKDETDPEEIKQMLKVGEDVEVLMRKTVVQTKLTEAGTYRLRITEDTLRDNAPLPGLKKRAHKENTSTETR